MSFDKEIFALVITFATLMIILFLAWFLTRNKAPRPFHYE